MVAQISAGDGFGCGAYVGRGWTLSHCKGGQGIDSVELKIWVGGGLGPGADVGGYEPSPVVSNERSPKCTCGRIGVSRAKQQASLRCNGSHCNGCRCVQLPVERCSGRNIVAGCAAMQQVPLVRLGPL